MRNWIRTTIANACPICGKTWCLIAKDGQSALCMRVEGNRQITLSSGEVGWIHHLGEPIPIKHKPKEREAPGINASALIEKWLSETTPERVIWLAKELGVTADSLIRLNTAWSEEHSSFAFPMRISDGSVVGIRLRSMSGKKWAVTGSHQGLFIPHMPAQKCCYITEGPTDCAAAISLGLFSVGRPSCSGGTSELAQFFKRTGVKKAIILADNDTDKIRMGQVINPGVTGASMLAEHLMLPTATLILPTKDTRDFVRMGGTRLLLENMEKQLIWRHHYGASH